MRTAAYIGKLTGTGMDPRTAQVHGEAIKNLLGEEFVTREHFDSGMAMIDARFSQVDARFAEVDARFAKVDARFDQLDAKIERAKAEIESKMYELHNASLKWTLGTCFMMVGLIYSIARFVK
jgi:uncharacterized protein YdcH (DUF465 family)